MKITIIHHLLFGSVYFTSNTNAIGQDKFIKPHAHDTQHHHIRRHRSRDLVEQSLTKCPGVCNDGSVPAYGDKLIPLLDIDGNGSFDDTCASANDFVQGLNKTDNFCEFTQIITSVIDCGCPKPLPVCSPCYGKDDIIPNYDKNISTFVQSTSGMETCADLVISDTVESIFVWKYSDDNGDSSQNNSVVSLTDNMVIDNTNKPWDPNVCRPYHFFHAALCDCPTSPPGEDPTQKTCELCPDGKTLIQDMTQIAFDSTDGSGPVLCGIVVGQLAQVQYGTECDAVKVAYASILDQSIQNCCA